MSKRKHSYDLFMGERGERVWVYVPKSSNFAYVRYGKNI